MVERAHSSQAGSSSNVLTGDGRLGAMLMRRAAPIAALLVALGVPALAGSTPDATLDVLAGPGDVYGPLSNDGDGAFTGLTATYGTDRWRAKYDVRRNVYPTERAGPGSLTQYPLIGGGTATVTPFTASETASELRAEIALPFPRTFAGVGWFVSATNYDYPRLRGLGVGIERYPDRGRGLKGYGSLFGYAVSGSTAALAARFTVVKADLGVAYRMPGTPLVWRIGYSNELREPANVSRDQLWDRSVPYIGLGFSR